MSEHKVSRAYHEALRRIGVQNPGEVNVGTPVHLTAAVDDLSHLQAPVPIIVQGAFSYRAAAVGVYSIPVEWQILSRGGAWVVYANTGTTLDLILYTQTVTRITAGATPLGVLCAPANPAAHGIANLSVANNGTNNVAAPGGVRITNESPIQIPFWIAFGDFVGLCGTATNQDAVGTIIIQEVPS